MKKFNYIVFALLILTAIELLKTDKILWVLSLWVGYGIWRFFVLLKDEKE